jgi:hypothetical protein
MGNRAESGARFPIFSTETTGFGYVLAPLFQAPGNQPMLSGYRRPNDANGIVLAHVHGQPDGAIAPADSRLTLPRLIVQMVKPSTFPPVRFLRKCKKVANDRQLGTH